MKVQKNMKTLVTGATGFIGNRLVNMLVEENRNVRCLIRRSASRDITKRLEALGVEIVYGDLLDKKSIIKAVKKVNIVHHLAGEVYSISSDKTYFMVNVRGTENLIEACLSEDIYKFIYLSSISAAGPNPDKDVLLKEIDDCNPIVPYGKSKLEAERILINFYRVNDFPVVIIRSPIVYGPKQKSELTKVFRMIKKGQFKIIGDGENIKSLCYIDNLIQGILLAEKKEGIKGEIYFLADERPYSMNELYQTISHLESVELSKKHIPTFVADLCGVLFDIVNKLFRFSFMPLFTMKTVTLSFACDISKAVRELGYAPQIDLKEGLAKTLEWYKNEVEN